MDRGLGIDFGADGGSVGGGIIVGNKTLHLNGADLNGGIAHGALQNIGGPNTWGGPVILDSNSQINSTSGLLVLTNTISSSVGASLTLGGAANLQIAGPIDSSVTNLLKVDAGTAMLGGSNTYNGLTSLYAGILRLQNNRALGTSLPTVYAGASLELDGTGTSGNQQQPERRLATR